MVYRVGWSGGLNWKTIDKFVVEKDYYRKDIFSGTTPGKISIFINLSHIAVHATTEKLLTEN